MSNTDLFFFFSHNPQEQVCRNRHCSTCLAFSRQVSWLCEFVTDSGWSQEILSTLSRVSKSGLGQGERAAFEDLLSSLVSLKVWLVVILMLFKF